MKKAFITMCAVLIASVSMAAGHVDSVRYLTTKAGQNWFISADGNIDWWKGSLKTPSGLNDYTGINDISFGASVNIGKWLSHKVGLRLSYDVNGANSYILGHHDRIEKIQFLYNNAVPVEGDIYETSFMFHNLHGDVLFSPVDFFQGYYNPNRIYTPVIYAGMGAACVTEGILATPTIYHNIFIAEDETQLQGCNFELSWEAGIINNFRLNDYLDLHLDLKYALTRWNIDSWFNEYKGYYYPNGTLFDPNQHDGQLVPNEAGEMPEYIRPKRGDNNFSVGLGLTWYIGGRIYELPYNYEKEMKEMSERIKNLEDELAAIPAPVAVEQTPCDTVVIYQDNIEAISYPFSIFFNLDSYQLMSKRDLVNLREIANVAKANNYKLRLRGSCDSATATPEYNQKLSENRCRKIMTELLEMGFPEENIILEPVGGVKELDPTEFDRRVLIDLIKYHE